MTVAVTNVDEKGMVTLSEMRPRVGAAVTAILADPDGGVTGTTWQWAESVAPDGAFTDINGATSASYTPVENDRGQCRHCPHTDGVYRRRQGHSLSGRKHGL